MRERVTSELSVTLSPPHKMYYSRLGLYSHTSHLEKSAHRRRSRRSGGRARGDCVVQEALSYRTTPRSIIEVHVMCAHAPEAIHSTMQTAHMRMLATSYAPRFPGSHRA